MTRFRFSTRFVIIVLMGVGVTVCHIQLHLYLSLSKDWTTLAALQLDGFQSSSTTSSAATCAINLYGLPRAFESIVLPSLQKNVIALNPNCDYFVHAYNLTQEEAGRSGSGGEVRPDEVLLLEKAVHQINPNVLVKFAWDQEADFWNLYKGLIDKVHNTMDEMHPQKHKYFPYKAKSYKYPTTVDNILKMWHSVQSVWQLMMKHGKTNNSNSQTRYTRVAMLRSDVLYLTPIDIWSTGDETDQRDSSNSVAVIPGFGRFPVSDRIIYGPVKAVEPWAIHRFDKLEEHVEFMAKNHPGWSMHSERFIKYTILPQIQEGNKYQIVEHSSMCFVRARADESIWISDCFIGNPNPLIVPKLYNMTVKDSILDHGAVIQAKVESVLGRRCVPGAWSKPAKYGPHMALSCGRG